MRRFVGAALLLLLMSPAPSRAQQVDSLAWLSGEWEAISSSGGFHVVEWVVERWSRPRAGTMLGTSQTVRRIDNSFSTNVSETTRAYEFMRIARDAEGVLTFYASPNGAPPTAFRLVASGRGEVTFENRQNDYPQRIVYRRQGDMLEAVISMADGSRPNSWRFRRLAGR